MTSAAPARPRLRRRHPTTCSLRSARRGDPGSRSTAKPGPPSLLRLAWHPLGRRSRALAAAVLAAALGLSGCGSDGSAAPAPFSGTELPDYRVAGAPLRDTDGQAYSLAEDTDKPLTLLFFGYTHCPTECPIVMNTLSATYQRLSEKDRAKVDVVFVTTDPARDDEQALRRYLDRYNPAFIGLTAALKTVVAVGSSVKTFVAEGDTLPSGGRDLGAHGTYVTALEGGRATTLWDMQTTPKQLADDVHTLLEKA